MRSMGRRVEIITIRPSTIYPNGFIWRALRSSPLRMEITERVEPQAGHGMPNIHSIGQKSNEAEIAGEKMDKISHNNPKERIITKNR